MSLKSAIQTQFMAFYIRKSCKFMSFTYVIIIFKIAIQTQFMAFYIRKSYKFMS